MRDRITRLFSFFLSGVLGYCVGYLVVLALLGGSGLHPLPTAWVVGP